MIIDRLKLDTICKIAATFIVQKHDPCTPEFAVLRALVIWDEAEHQIYEEDTGRTKGAAPTGTDTTPPFKGPVADSFWIDEKETK
jgi:hypothetical protein